MAHVHITCCINESSWRFVAVMQEAGPALEVKLFGRFEVIRDGAPVPASSWGRRKTESLLKILLTKRGCAFTQDQLIEALYGSKDPDKKLGNLRGRISQLRHALEPDLNTGSDSIYILRIGGGYCFSSEAPCWLDTERFQERITTGLQAREKGQWQLAAEAFESAIDLYRGDFLVTDRYEEWSLSSRERWQEKYLTALSQLAACYARLGDCERAIDCCKRALDVRPGHEPIIRQLMQYYYAIGEDSRALEVFETGRQVLRERLDVDLSPETRVLCDQIRRSELPRRANAFDPLRIAVLPFLNLCPDPADECFVDGVVEELIYSLSKVQGLRVIAQTSAFSYKGSRKSIAQIGRELRVGTAVEGSVRRADRKLRITAQLVRVDNEEHMWAGEYDRQLDDLLAVQSDIAGNVTAALKGCLLAGRCTRTWPKSHLSIKP